jgi:acyl homoserine lactone synthase
LVELPHSAEGEATMTDLTIARAGEGRLSADLLDSMFRLRHDVFHERLGWDVRSEGGREHDWYDLIGPHYLVAHEGRRALGCWRMLPTQGPYMLRDIFPQLLAGDPAPAAPGVWEISRFAVADEACGHSFGFGDMPAEMLRAMVRFAVRRDIHTIVGVTSAAVERMLRQLGFSVERLGPPQRIGRVLSVAFRLAMDAATQRAVCGEVLEALPQAA